MLISVLMFLVLPSVGEVGTSFLLVDKVELLAPALLYSPSPATGQLGFLFIATTTLRSSRLDRASSRYGSI